MKTKKEQAKEVAHFKEMVQARSLIQPELIRLLEFQRTYRVKLTGPRLLRVMGLLASVGFSLWRAAFLFPAEVGQKDTYLDNVDTFISKIISDNTIGFSDDKHTWSLWHYMGVARSSLLDALLLLGSAQQETPKSAAIRARLSNPPLLKDNAAEQWNELFQAMQYVREQWTSRFIFADTAPKLFK